MHHQELTAFSGMVPPLTPNELSQAVHIPRVNLSDNALSSSKPNSARFVPPQPDSPTLDDDMRMMEQDAAYGGVDVDVIRRGHRHMLNHNRPISDPDADDWANVV